MVSIPIAVERIGVRDSKGRSVKVLTNVYHI